MPHLHSLETNTPAIMLAFYVRFFTAFSYIFRLFRKCKSGKYAGFLLLLNWFYFFHETTCCTKRNRDILQFIHQISELCWLSSYRIKMHQMPYLWSITIHHHHSPTQKQIIQQKLAFTTTMHAQKTKSRIFDKNHQKTTFTMRFLHFLKKDHKKCNHELILRGIYTWIIFFCTI